MAAKAYRKGFSQANRHAFVADGMKCNWTIWQRHFPTFTPILDFLHAVGYVDRAAMAVGGEEDFGWGICLEWTQALWQGRVEDVVDELHRWLEWQPLAEANSLEEDLQTIVQKSLTDLLNNRNRMDSPAYRREELPITSSLMESW